MLKVAVGYLGMSAAEFWEMTPQELIWRHEAKVASEKRQWEQTAQLACWVLTPFLSKPLTVAQLLPEPASACESVKPKDKYDSAFWHRYADELKKGKRRAGPVQS